MTKWIVVGIIILAVIYFLSGCACAFMPGIEEGRGVYPLCPGVK